MSHLPLQHAQKRLLRERHFSHLLHPFLPLLLLLEEFLLAGDVSSVEVAGDVFVEGTQRLARDDLRSDGCLNGDLELGFGENFL